MDFKKIEQEKAAIKVYEEDWDSLAAELDKNGYKWASGGRYTETDDNMFNQDSSTYLYIDKGLWGYEEPESNYYIYLPTTKPTPEERLLKAIFGKELNLPNNPTNTPVITRLLINPDKKICIFFIGNEKFVVKCHQEDKFDWKIAAGVAYSRFNKCNKALNYLRGIMREKQYYLYCFKLMYDFDTTQIENTVKKYETDFKERLIKEQIRKAECEIRKTKYIPAKIEREFINL